MSEQDKLAANAAKGGDGRPAADPGDKALPGVQGKEISEADAAIMKQKAIAAAAAKGGATKG